MPKQATIFLLSTISIYIAFANATQTTYTYKTVGDLALTAVVDIPPSSSYKQLPVIFSLHGGGLLNGNAKSSTLSEQIHDEMLGRGWAITSINYRLAPQALLPDIVEDVEDAFKWVRNDLSKIISIDPDAIAIWGVSVGGGLAAIAGYKFTPRPQALILISSLTNWTHIEMYDPKTPVSKDLVSLADSLRQPISETYVGQDGPRWFLFELLVRERKSGWLLTTSDPQESPSNIINELKKYSAAYHVDEHYPPTYLIHGLADDLALPSHSIEMATQLKKSGIAYKLDLIEGADHYFKVTDQILKMNILPGLDFAAKYITKKDCCANYLRKPNFTNFALSSV